MPSGWGPDLTGRKFDRLVVIGRSDQGGHKSWECRCECGNSVFTDSYKLTTGQKKSCGCLLVEARLARAAHRSNAEEQRYLLQQAVVDRPLGLCCIKGCEAEERSLAFCAHHYDMWNRLGHPLADRLADRRKLVSTGRSKEIKTYSAMKSRCTNPNVRAYPGYGGRGIKVCDRWMVSFENFLEDMGKAPSGTSLEREDVNGNYEPSNCHWATPREQMRNTRATLLSPELVRSARERYQKGESVASIARDLGVSYSGMYAAVSGRSWVDIQVEGSG